MPEENNLSENTPPVVPSTDTNGEENLAGEKPKKRSKDTFGFRIAFVSVAFIVVLAVLLAGLSGVLGLQGSLRTQVMTTEESTVTCNDVSATMGSGSHRVPVYGLGDSCILAEADAESQAKDREEEVLGTQVSVGEGTMTVKSIMNDSLIIVMTQKCLLQPGCTVAGTETLIVDDVQLACEYDPPIQEDPAGDCTANGTCGWEVSGSLGCVPIETPTPDPEPDPEPDPPDDTPEPPAEEPEPDPDNTPEPDPDIILQCPDEKRQPQEKEYKAAGQSFKWDSALRATGKAKIDARRNAWLKFREFTLNDGDPNSDIPLPMPISWSTAKKQIEAVMGAGLRNLIKCPGPCTLQPEDYPCTLTETYDSDEGYPVFTPGEGWADHVTLTLKITCYPTCDIEETPTPTATASIPDPTTTPITF